MSTTPLPPLPFEPGDTANIECANQHDDDIDLQHTLSIERDEDEDDGNRVFLTIISHGQPDGDILVDRRELLAALGVTL